MTIPRSRKVGDESFGDTWQIWGGGFTTVGFCEGSLRRRPRGLLPLYFDSKMGIQWNGRHMFYTLTRGLLVLCKNTHLRSLWDMLGMDEISNLCTHTNWQTILIFSYMVTLAVLSNLLKIIKYCIVLYGLAHMGLILYNVFRLALKHDLIHFIDPIIKLRERI